MDRKEIGINTRNWVDLAQGLLESPCECSIEPAGSISQRVSYYLSVVVHGRTTEF